MSVALRLGDVWAQALDAADFTNTQYPDAARKADLVNSALKNLHYMCVASSQNFVCNTYSLNVVAGTEYYTLPSDFYQLLKIYIIDDGMRRVVRRTSFEQAHGMESAMNQNATLEVNYAFVAPKFKNPPDDNEIIQTTFPDGFEDVIVMEVALRLLIRAEKPTTDIKAQRDMLLGMARDYLAPRDAAEPLPFVDVHQRWRRPWPFALVRPAIADIRYMLFGNKLRIFQTDSREI